LGKAIEWTEAHRIFGLGALRTMFAALGPPSEGVLRHPDELSELGSDASIAPAASTISVNPFLRPQSNEYLRRAPPKLGTVMEAHPNDHATAWTPDLNNLPSRASAEPPTDHSRVNAMRSIGGYEAEANVVEASLPPYGLQPQNSISLSSALPLNSLDSVRSAEPEYPAQHSAKMQGWRGNSEIDRLIREKLEGQHSFRAHTGKNVQKLADNHVNGFGQTIDAVIDGFWGALEAFQYGGQVLLGGLPDAPPACKRVKQAVPIIVTIDETDEPAKNPGDEFADTVSQPSATREPVPDRIQNQAATSTPVGTEGLSPESWPESAPSYFVPPGEEPKGEQKKPGRGGRRPGDTASALSMSSAMTSSAAALLGGVNAKAATNARQDLATGTSQPSRTMRPGDSKTVLASSNMKSGAAASLGAFVSKPAATAQADSTSPAREEEDPAIAAAIRASMEDAAGQSREASPAPKRSGQAKSVLAQSTVMKSSAAGALGGFVSASGRTTAPDAEVDGPELQTPSKPKKVPGKAKSVLAQSNVMSSSAAGALGGLVAQGGTTPAPRRPDDKKSALAASTVMTSSAASTLGTLSAAKKTPQGQKVEDSSPELPPAETLQGSRAKDETADLSGNASAKPRPKAKANTVISGLNTSSSASALLGPMMQAKAKAKPT